MKNSRFTKGTGAYKCIACGKLTRETGEEESSCQLCKACHRYSLWENHHSDNHDREVAKENCNDCAGSGYTAEWVTE